MTSVPDIFSAMEYGPAPEATGPALQWIEAHGGEFGHYIGGSWTTPGESESFATENPATGAMLARIAQGSIADVDAAVAAARRAQPDWEALGGHGRARYLYALARQVQKHSRLLAVLESLDNGKPIRESRDIDVPLVARHFYHHAGWAQLMETELPHAVSVGVVGQIIPWNFPLLMLAWKVAPALAMGNTVVLKPAEFTSLTALLFASIAEDVGLPPGVLNVVTGDGRTGEALVLHPDVDKIAFTGSTEVGRKIRVATAGSGKRLSLELGGKSPFLVFEDADLDSAVEGVVDAIWFNQGQVCCGGSRILVQEGIAEALIAKLRARMETLRVGDPLDKAVDIGAIVAPVQLEKIQSLVQQGQDEGATLWQPSWACPTEGSFYPPTLLTDVSPSSTVAEVEIFGPVVVLMTFRTPDEAVELANNTRYGLAASVWTESVNLALDIAPRLAAGTVWVNCTNLFDAAAGFGGYRESGFGREGGREGLEEYVMPEWERRRRFSGEDTVAPDLPKPRGSDASPMAKAGTAVPGIDRTAKLYIGGKQVRPDGGYSDAVFARDGRAMGDVSRGNRKDIRNAVEAAQKAAGWGRVTAHQRAQVLFYLAENLLVRRDEFVARLALEGRDASTAATEFDAAIERIYRWAAFADKWDGHVHATPYRNVTLAMPEPLGVIGVVCPASEPLLGLVSTVTPAVAMGNRVVVLPSSAWPLAATDLYQVLETSDVPDGVVNIVTGPHDELVPVLAAHDNVEGVWHFGAASLAADVERLSAGNMKRTWTDYGHQRDWYDVEEGAGSEFLRHATQIKNIWVPYGE